jgi:hypothetical protein
MVNSGRKPHRTRVAHWAVVDSKMLVEQSRILRESARRRITNATDALTRSRMLATRSRQCLEICRRPVPVRDDTRTSLREL